MKIESVELEATVISPQIQVKEEIDPVEIKAENQERISEQAPVTPILPQIQVKEEIDPVEIKAENQERIYCSEWIKSVLRDHSYSRPNENEERSLRLRRKAHLECRYDYDTDSASSSDMLPPGDMLYSPDGDLGSDSENSSDTDYNSSRSQPVPKNVLSKSHPSNLNKNMKCNGNFLDKYFCCLCSELCTSEESLLEHTAAKHPNASYRCGYCHSRFSRPDSFKSHMCLLRRINTDSASVTGIRSSVGPSSKPPEQSLNSKKHSEGLNVVKTISIGYPPQKCPQISQGATKSSFQPPKPAPVNVVSHVPQTVLSNPTFAGPRHSGPVGPAAVNPSILNQHLMTLFSRTPANQSSQKNLPKAPIVNVSASALGPQISVRGISESSEQSLHSKEQAQYFKLVKTVNIVYAEPKCPQIPQGATKSSFQPSKPAPVNVVSHVPQMVLSNSTLAGPRLSGPARPSAAHPSFLNQHRMTLLARTPANQSSQNNLPKAPTVNVSASIPGTQLSIRPLSESSKQSLDSKEQSQYFKSINIIYTPPKCSQIPQAAVNSLPSAAPLLQNLSDPVKVLSPQPQAVLCNSSSARAWPSGPVRPAAVHPSLLNQPQMTLCIPKPPYQSSQNSVVVSFSPTVNVSPPVLARHKKPTIPSRPSSSENVNVLVPVETLMSFTSQLREEFAQNNPLPVVQRQAPRAGPLQQVGTCVETSEVLQLQTTWRSKAAFPCRQCGAVSRQPALKVRHRYLHRGSRLHRCQCGRTFQRRLHLLRHQVQHAESGRFVCARCGNTFDGAQKQTWHKHEFLKSRQYSKKKCAKPFDCVCGRKFVRPSALLWHMLKNAKPLKQTVKTSPNSPAVRKVR